MITSANAEERPRRRRLVRVGSVPAAKRRLKRVGALLPACTEDVDRSCSICCETMASRATLECGHTMCATCLARLARTDHRCPFCRSPFAPPVSKPCGPLGTDGLTDSIVAEIAAASVEVSRRTLGQEFGITQRWLSAHRGPAVRRDRLRRVLEENAEIAVTMVAQFLEGPAGRRR